MKINQFQTGKNTKRCDTEWTIVDRIKRNMWFGHLRRKEDSIFKAGVAWQPPEIHKSSIPQVITSFNLASPVPDSVSV